jgi:hypothetical protein
MAQPGFNAQLLIGTATTSNAFTAIGDVLNVSPSLDCDEIDVTPISSTGHKAYIPGARSVTLSFEIAQEATNVQHNLLLTNWSGGITNYYVVEPPGEPDGTAFTTSTTDWRFRGFITNVTPAADPSDKFGGNVTVRVTEAPDFTAWA